jgi:hypothetical protein
LEPLLSVTVVRRGDVVQTRRRADSIHGRSLLIGER